MTDHNALTAWAFRPSDRYHQGFSIACENDDGTYYWGDLERGASFCIIVRAKDIGVTDAMLCGGIQSLTDAKAIVTALQSAPTPTP